ncbi:hypothetical protein TWF281_006022 [Arthrobotrys megalospora]
MASFNPHQQRQPPDGNGSNATEQSNSAVAQNTANQNSGDLTTFPGSGVGNTNGNTRSFPFSGSENVFVPTTFGTIDSMNNPFQGSLPHPGGPSGQQVGYAPGGPVVTTGMEIATRPPGLLDEESQGNGTGNLAVSTVLSQHVTNAIRGGAEGKIIEYYCVPEINRDVAIIPTRHLKCTGIPGDSSPSTLKMFFEQFGDVSGLFIEKLLSNGFLYVSFFNLQSSIQCHRDLQTKWPPIYCARTTLENVVNNFAAHPLTTEGEVQVDVLGGQCDTQTIVGVLGAIGDLHTVQTYRDNEFCTVFAEFYDTRHAVSAIQHLNGQRVEGLEIRVCWPEVERIAWTKASQMIEIHEDQNVCVVHARSTQLVNDARRLYGIPFSMNAGVQDFTPHHYGGSNALVRGHSGPLAIYDPDSPPRYDVGMINRNILDLHKIRNGLDLRTTIMIRNIPNHLPQSVIKAWLDEVSYRKYDFLYLRIDFANHCNVGYCFVNYLHIHDIIHFVERRAGTRWSQFGSDKIVEVSYANIQGKAALIEKFRNSSVMDQPFEFRPRAFHSSGDNFGLDMDFPPPNNLNRKLRSVTAAEHSGLYNPRHRNGYGYHSPARFGGFGHHRGRGYGNFGHRHFGNGNGYGMNGMVRPYQTNRLAITMPGYEPAPQQTARYHSNRVQHSIPAGGAMDEVARANAAMHDANFFAGPATANGQIQLSHSIPAQISPPPSTASFGGPNGAIATSPRHFQSAMFPTPSDIILRSESRIRQENVPPRPRSGARSRGHQTRPQSALLNTGIPSPVTSVIARSPAQHPPSGNINGNPQNRGPHTPAATNHYGNGQFGTPGFNIYNSPLSPAGLVNAGYIPTNPAPPGFGASTFTDAYGEANMPGSQDNRARSPVDYNVMARNIDAIRRIWEQ